jgi:hypothetical protein
MHHAYVVFSDLDSDLFLAFLAFLAAESYPEAAAYQLATVHLEKAETVQACQQVAEKAIHLVVEMEVACLACPLEEEKADFLVKAACLALVGVEASQTEEEEVHDQQGRRGKEMVEGRPGSLGRAWDFGAWGSRVLGRRRRTRMLWSRLRFGLFHDRFLESGVSLF